MQGRTEAARTPSPTAPRIAWTHDHDAGRTAQALGFDHLLISGDAPAQAAADARQHRLLPLIDLDLAHAPADVIDVGTDSPFSLLPATQLDPRKAPLAGDTAVALISSAAEAEALADWWAQRIEDLRQQGFAGVRLLGLADLPGDHLAGFLVRLRSGCPSAILFGWTPGLPWAALRAVPPGVLDMVAGSLPWWDGQADWLWQEAEQLRRVAPVIMPTDAALGSPAGQRRLHLAGLLGDGWLTPLDGDPDRLRALNALSIRQGGAATLITSPGAAVMGVVRTDVTNVRRADAALIALVNDHADQACEVEGASVLPHVGGVFERFTAADGTVLDPMATVRLAPGQGLVFSAAAQAVRPLAKVDRAAAKTAAARPRLAIEAVAPAVDGGRFPVRRILGGRVDVEADVIGDGHDKLAAVLRWQGPGADGWQECRMHLVVNDRWTASFPLEALGLHRYTIQVWRDHFATFADELAKKDAAGVSITLELREGRTLVEETAAKAQPAHRAALQTVLRQLDASSEAARRDVLLSPATAALMAAADLRLFMTELDQPIPIQAERAGAGFASWYEVFPRSLSDDPARHGTFKDVVRHLPRIRAMGFDVLYFPPIHPIGRKNRKGRNNTLTPAADDPGSPYAIGSADGGHDALHPELGTLEDFQALRAACAEHGLELAMDFAIQCSPDHPWLAEHPDWFTWRPDGTIRYAENPPKKYEDIVNVDFYARGAVPDLWLALCEVVLHWAGQGVRLFRVDNPHTKPLPFWEWMIAEVQARYPDAVFLAEAFTRPKVMYRLAKVGFSQSYTYFTWREQKWEFEQYLTELTQGPGREFFRPHFFVNTPDINPVYLQGAGRGSYLARAALAATLSGLWGVYNGFELCEGTPVPGKEEYLDSEKYQLRAWDWDRPGNIVAEITRLNAIRRANPALHSHLGVSFLPASGDRVLVFEKATADRSNVLLVAISLDVSGPQTVDFVPSYARYAPEAPALAVTDLLNPGGWQWRDRSIRITLPPDRPYAIWRVQPAS